MAWYPGSESRADAFKHAGAGAEELGQPLENGHSASAPSTYIPWLFRAGLSPHEVAPHALRSAIAVWQRWVHLALAGGAILKHGTDV